jgi:hypothetical protein
MTQDLLSRALTITDARAAAALIDPLSQAMVLAFHRPRSLAEAARAGGFDLKRLHHHVLRFCRLGLLEVAETRARAGRPIKLYRTTAEAFFVPHAAAPELLTERLARELRASLRTAAVQPGKGLVFYADPQGVPRMEGARGDAPAEAMETWRTLRLSPEDRAAFAAELDGLIARFAQAGHGGEGRGYIVHAALAPQPGEDRAATPRPEPAAWSAGARIRIARAL